MARTKKKKPAIRFELGWSALFAVGIVCFCIFLWMFLLGIWTGQTLLEPGNTGGGGFKIAAAKLWQDSKAVKRLANNKIEKTERVGKKREEPNQGKHKQLSPKDSVFTLQVAAFRDRDKARKVVLQWRARDYEAFYLAPERPDGSFCRVFIGSFPDISEAKKLAAKLANTEKSKYFIALISSQEKRFP